MFSSRFLERGLTPLHACRPRARLSRHRRRGLATALTVALFSLASPLPALAEAAHGIAIQLVPPGREGLELSARLAPDGGPLQQNIAWSIRNADGAPVYSGNDGTADVSLPPGDYVVDATYGASVLEKLVSLPQATRLKIDFVLEAGGLRIESLIGDMEVPPAAARLRVFAMDSPRLVASAVKPGQIIRLPAGTYRIESQVSTGNVKAVTDVQVTAGRVSTVRISHKAGLARLAFAGSPASGVRWEVSDGSGKSVVTREGIAANVTLLPGSYTAQAQVGAKRLSASFSLGAGDVRVITLGK